MHDLLLRLLFGLLCLLRPHLAARVVEEADGTEVPLPVVPSNRSLAPLSVPVYVYHAAILHRVQLIRLAAG